MQQELENELMAVIMLMEEESSCADASGTSESAEANALNDECTDTGTAADKNVLTASATTQATPDTAPTHTELKGAKTSATTHTELKDAATAHSTTEHSPVILQRHTHTQRTAAPLPPPPRPASPSAGTSVDGQAAPKNVLDVMDCPSPLSCSWEEGGGDDEEGAGVVPLALEAALDAVVEEANAPWTAAVTAAMTAAENEDREAWHVALEAALEVATAHAVSTKASLFREKSQASKSPTQAGDAQTQPAESADMPSRRIRMEALQDVAHSHVVGVEQPTAPPPPARDAARDAGDAMLSQSPPDHESAGPEEVHAPVCIPRGAAPGVCGSEFAVDNSMPTVEKSIFNFDRSIISENYTTNTSMANFMNYSPAETPYEQQRTQQRTPQRAAAPKTPSHAAQHVGSPQPSPAWVAAIVGDDKEMSCDAGMCTCGCVHVCVGICVFVLYEYLHDISGDAGEAACRSIEAEIIRRCILDTSPLDARKARTPTDKRRLRTPASGSSLGRATPAGDSSESSTPLRVPYSPSDGKPAQPSFDHAAEMQPCVDDSAAANASIASRQSEEMKGTHEEQQQHQTPKRTQQSSQRSRLTSSPEEREGGESEQVKILFLNKEQRKAQRSAAPPQAQLAQGRSVEYVKDLVPLITDAPPPQQQQPTPPRSSKWQPPQTYTVSDLADFEIHPARSPSESDSHTGLSNELLTWQVASSAASTATAAVSSSPHHNNIARDERGVLDSPLPVCSTPPISPSKKPKASPAKGVNTKPFQSSLAAPQPNKVSAGMDFTRWLGVSLGNGAIYVGAFSAKTMQATALSPVASSPSHAAESAPHSPIVSYRQRLPVHTASKQVHVEPPSPAAPSLLPTVRPLRHAPSDQRREDMIAKGPSPLPDAALATAEEFGEEGKYTETSLPPLQGQLFLDGEELVIPDPALGLLNCACERTVSVRPPIPQGAASGSWVDDFVDVCIDCGAVHQRVQLL